MKLCSISRAPLPRGISWHTRSVQVHVLHHAWHGQRASTHRLPSSTHLSCAAASAADASATPPVAAPAANLTATQEPSTRSAAATSEAADTAVSPSGTAGPTATPATPATTAPAAVSAPSPAPAAPAPAAPGAPLQAGGAAGGGDAVDWKARQRKRLVEEILASLEKQAQGGGAKRKGMRPISTRPSHSADAAPAPKYTSSQLLSGFEALEALLPGFSPSPEALPAAQWAQLVTDINGAAARIIALKMAWPQVNLANLVMKYPRALLLTPAQILDDASKVRELLKGANNPDSIIEAEPACMTPKTLASILVTINKWYHLEKDPVKVLENDPDIVRRAQDMDQPFEPVYADEKGNWIVPQLNYREKRADWQKYIDRTRYKQP